MFQQQRSIQDWFSPSPMNRFHREVLQRLYTLFRLTASIRMQNRSSNFHFLNFQSLLQREQCFYRYQDARISMLFYKRYQLFYIYFRCNY
jgi:hypothetical protein